MTGMNAFSAARAPGVLLIPMRICAAADANAHNQHWQGRITPPAAQMQPHERAAMRALDNFMVGFNSATRPAGRPPATTRMCASPPTRCRCCKTPDN